MPFKGSRLIIRLQILNCSYEMNADEISSPEKTEDERIKNPESFALARRIVLRHGWNTTSYQILNPGIERWFDLTREAVVGFSSSKKVLVVAGAPICPKGNLRKVIEEFESDAAKNRRRVCYFCAESRLEFAVAELQTHSKFLLGAQPVWNPKNWSEIVKKHKSLRAQINRARNKNVKVAEWSREKAFENPSLMTCLKQWLDSKGLPPLRFLVEPDTLSRLFDRRIFVAETPEKIVGFVLLSPVASRNGWLFEQFVHCSGAPNGTVESMIDTAMRTIAEDGCEYATLGLAPLSRRAKIEPFENPLWLKIVLAWMRRHGQRFYNFDGLDAFKAKLQPENWEPVFAISNERKISPTTLYAIAAAFSGNAPFRLFFGGLLKAAATELNWLKQKLKLR